jgi:hypothetical protein
MYTTTSNIPKFCDLPIHHVFVVSQANTCPISTSDNINKAIKVNFRYTLRQYNNYVYRLKNIGESRIKIPLRIGYTRDLMTSIIFVLFSHFLITITQLLIVSYRYSDIINVVYYF